MEPTLDAVSRGLFTKSHLLFASDDPNEVCQHVATVFKPHRLTLHGRAYDASMHHLHYGPVSLNKLRYGADVQIDPGSLDDFFLLQIPLNGLAEIQCGSNRFSSSPQLASLVSPSIPLAMRWGTDNVQLCVRFERERLERHLALHLGHGLHAPLEFDPSFNLQTTGGRYFARLLQLLMEEMSAAEPSSGHPLLHQRVAEQYEAGLFNALIYGQPHSFTREIERPAPGAAPYFIRRVEDYLREHYVEASSIEDLAIIAGTSVRTLHSGFRQFRETTPMAYLKELRLQRAHGLLLAARGSDGPPITQIALACGFNHLGRFAIDYRKRFGESPSVTARFGDRSSRID
jgi:AraC-like DNA-binding protein